MKFTRIPSKLKVSAYPDMKPGNIVRLRGYWAWGYRSQNFIVLEQRVNQGGYKKMNERSRLCNRQLFLLNPEGKVMKTFIEHVKEYC